MTSSGTGEDIQFCLAAKKVGARVFSDTSTVIGHLGNPPIIGDKESETFNDPAMMEKLYGAYRKYDCLEICQQTLTASTEEKGVVLAQ